jgi:hypothetical protein
MTEKKESQKRLSCYFGDSPEDKETWDRYQMSLILLKNSFGLRVNESAFLKRLISLGLESYNRLQGVIDE